MTTHQPPTRRVDMPAPNLEFAELASSDRILATVAALEQNGIRALVVDSGQDARRQVVDLLPEGAEVFNATSRTLDTIGLAEEIERSARYPAVRPRLYQMDRVMQGREVRKAAAAPDYFVSSVHAVTEQGSDLRCPVSRRGGLAGGGTASNPLARYRGQQLAHALPRELDEVLYVQAGWLDGSPDPHLDALAEPSLDGQ